ncbi:enoyl-CoA hydratase/isomerase family protein [Paraburkholderia caballeronis]|uniref:enoyl-CoA hydratase/isomerase family protein n=1 Tax=Paraburkholderia caballeronis TaxID=416943 RepID=UPI0010667174|nr:enoyl-CoA hydratase/isomerase family protein [Paraburkholderia caballeronis]TDV14958.1 enoyl-CoA hydratase/carnithine racemase [Paraburkholderia caballeronis]TDV16918.1 enoyl-CoA hydratase/carnithine racemase [Paraburkholderia caballeronis]TDV25694.1 enoyl-CoA hydratase/carnithine racemase [Paraburkholderia caballeronis]
MSATRATMDKNDAQNDVLFRVVNRVAIVTLNRPAALNALSPTMVRDLAALLDRVRNDDHIVAMVLNGAGQKGFCAGGDVRALYRLACDRERDGDAGWLQFFLDEYRLDYALHTLSKPLVALLDGVTMGGGMGLGQAARLRVATTRSKIAMPETRIGMLPDVGATRFLAAMPVETELYVGLTGALLTGADAVQCGLADACVSGEWLDGFEDRLQRMPLHDDDLPAALRRVFVPMDNDVAQTGALASLAPLIGRHFDRHADVARIVATVRADLERDPPASERDWLNATLDALTHYSPTMLAVTREALLRGRQMSLADCFRMELGIVSRAIEEGDFCEGVRAHLVDKDRAPRWAPATLAEVRPERVRHFLVSPWRAGTHPLADLGG